MSDELSLHNLSLEQIDALIEQTRSTLSDEERKEFTNELHHVDIEYVKDIQTLIDSKFKD